MPQHGLEINVCDAIPQLNPSIPTLGHYFKHAGYRTPYFGKWHLSTEENYANGVGLTPYGFEEWPGPDAQGMPNQGASEDAPIADQAMTWLEQHQSDTQPWLLTCSLVNPHDVMFYKRMAQPVQAELPSITDTLPPNFDDDLSTKPQAHAQYQKLWGMIWEMPGGGLNAATTYDWLKSIDYYYYVTKLADDQIVRILNKLDSLDLDQDTLVLFVSDHGEMAGSHRIMGKGPFAYEESVHVPLVVRWPGRVPAGVATRSLAQTVDLLPTMLDVAGITSDNHYLPGKSLKPILLSSPQTRINDHVLMAYGMSLVQVVAENASYGATMPVDISVAPWKFHAIYDGTYKYVHYYEDNMTAEEYELYNVAADAPELKNLANMIVWRQTRNDMAAKLQQAEQAEMAPINPAFFNAPFGPVLKISQAGPGRIRLQYDTQKGIQYQPQATADFLRWTDLGGPVSGTGSEVETTLDSVADGRQFYRVKRL
jgi:arylsulfatase